MLAKKWKVLATLCVFAVLYQIYWTLRLRLRKMPPGPSRLMLYYYVLKTRLLRGKIDEMELARVFHKIYGEDDMISFSLFGIDIINLYSSKIAKQVLNHKYALSRPIFHNSSAGELNIESTADGTNPFSNINGKDWEKRRKLAQSIMFRMCTSKFVGKILDETITNVIIPKLNEKSENKELWFPTSLMKYCAFNTVFYANYGHHMAFTNPLYEPIVNVITETFKLFKIGIGLAIMPKWVLFIDKLLPNSNYYKIVNIIKKRDELFEKFKAYIDENKFNEKKRKQNNNQEAIYYIDYIQNELTESEVAADTSALFGAGTDTTSSSLNFAIIYAAKYQYIQNKVRNELIECYNKKKNVSDGDSDGIRRFCINWLMELTYFRAFIYEVIRVSSVTKAGLPHYTTNDIYINISDNKQYCIPKGTVIGYNIELIHKNTKNKEYWIDSSNRMCLENWINSTTNKFEINQSFLSFGSGRRDCVGRNLALKEIYIIIAYLLMNYSFSFKNENDKEKEIKTVWNGVNVIHPPIGVIVKRL